MQRTLCSQKRVDVVDRVRVVKHEVCEEAWIGPSANRSRRRGQVSQRKVESEASSPVAQDRSRGAAGQPELVNRHELRAQTDRVCHEDEAEKSCALTGVEERQQRAAAFVDSQRSKAR